MSRSNKQHKELAQQLYDEYRQGKSKNAIERDVWNANKSHGKKFDAYILKWLGIEVKQPSKQTVRIAELEEYITKNGLKVPGKDEPLWASYGRQALEAALAAVQTWNDPYVEFKTANFSLLLVAAFNSLFVAILEKEGRAWKEAPQDEDSLTLATRQLAASVLGRDASLKAVHENLEFWINLRDRVTHRYLPALDISVSPLAQAALLNFEKLIASRLGDEFRVGKRLTVPIQLSGFHDAERIPPLKSLLGQLPSDIATLLSRSYSNDEFNKDEAFMFRIALVANAIPSGRSPDSVITFVRPEDVTEELRGALANTTVLNAYKTPEIASLGATAVCDAVQRRLHVVFNANDHAAAARHYKVRVKKKEEHKTLKPQYCQWFPVGHSYAYTERWIEFLCEKLADKSEYKRATGRDWKDV